MYDAPTFNVGGVTEFRYGRVSAIRPLSV